MNGVMLVAGREFRVQVRTKGFAIGLIIMAFLVSAAVVGPKLIGGWDEYTVGVTGSQGRTLEPIIKKEAAAAGATVDVVRFADEQAARTAVAEGDADAALPNGEKIFSDGELSSSLAPILQNAHRAVQTERQLEAAGLSPGEVTQALQVKPLDQISVTGDTQYEAARYALAFFIVMVLYMMIFGSAMGVAMGVVEEKSSRIVEILLISIRPWQLLAGKILAWGVLGVIQIAVIAAAGLVATAAIGAAPELPPGTIGIIAGAFAGFIFGFLYFGAMAAAMGSLVSRQEDMGSAMGPMTTLLFVLFGVSYWALLDPTSIACKILSMIPPFSAMVMPVRAASVDVELWEIGLAAALMSMAVVGMLLLGGKVYERSILRTGAKIKLTEALRSPTPA